MWVDVLFEILEWIIRFIIFVLWFFCGVCAAIGIIAYFAFVLYNPLTNSKKYDIINTQRKERGKTK